MKNILIFGAGSIGNHMSYASIKLKYDVSITDINPGALIRMKLKIFPKRYGKWNSKIKILSYKNVFKSKKIFDLVVIGTPPNTHVDLFKKINDSIKFKKILIEKPITEYLNSNGDKVLLKNNKKNNNIFCGYNHSVSKSFKKFFQIFKKNINKINLYDVKWKENWTGILNAHPWLKNEYDSYLGSIKKGGGCLQEHSHGLHLLFVILKEQKINLINLNHQKNILYNRKGSKTYDSHVSIISKYKNIYIKYETDVISNYTEKSIQLSGKNYYLKWVCNFTKSSDAIIEKRNNKCRIIKFKKTRSSEFENELKTIFKTKQGKDYKNSFLNLENALNVKKIYTNILNEKK